MKLTPWYLVAFAPIAVVGCSGAFLGQYAVLAVTLCIFFGTIGLVRGDRRPPSSTAAFVASAAVPVEAVQEDRVTRQS
jgi:hypothetical protein